LGKENMNLTDSEKKLLRMIAGAVRAGNLKEEFILAWGTNGPVAAFGNNEGWLPFPDMSKAKLEALQKADLIRTRQDSGSEYVTHISVTKLGFDACDSNFTEPKRPNKEWIMIWISLAGLVVTVLIFLYSFYFD
jgi:hypothetical protein